jgi:hypothetical protein
LVAATTTTEQIQMTRTALASKTKITMATVKTFIKEDGLFLHRLYRFDGTTDGCEPTGQINPEPVIRIDPNARNLGIRGASFVGSGGDYLTLIDTPTHYGIKVYNCCGCFQLLRFN